MNWKDAAGALKKISIPAATALGGPAGTVAATIIAGAAPAASSTLAVISCTTSLVSTCTRGFLARRRESSSATRSSGRGIGFVGIVNGPRQFKSQSIRRRGPMEHRTCGLDSTRNAL